MFRQRDRQLKPRVHNAVDPTRLRYTFGEGVGVKAQKTRWELTIRRGGYRLSGPAYDRFTHEVPTFENEAERTLFLRFLDNHKNPQVTGPSGDPDFKQSVSTFTTWTQLEKIVFPVLRELGSPVIAGAPSLAASVNIDAALKAHVESRLNLSIHKNRDADATMRTFHYLFYHMKCGIFVAIRNGKLAIFCPFANSNFKNTWGEKMNIDAALENELIRKHTADEMKRLKDLNNEGFPYLPKNQWWANGGIIDNVQQKGEWGDHYLMELHHLISECCRDGDLPDCDFFLNKRDYPQFLVKNGAARGGDGGPLVEPYGFLFDKDVRQANQVTALEQYGASKYKYDAKQDTFAPILSFYSNPRFADIMMPNVEDYVAGLNKTFITFGSRPQPEIKAKPQVVELRHRVHHKACFRGSATGAGITAQTNQRLHLATLGAMEEAMEPDVDLRLLDVKIVGANIRHKKMPALSLRFLNLASEEFLRMQKPEGDPIWTVISPQGEPPNLSDERRINAWNGWYFRSLFFSQTENKSIVLNTQRVPMDQQALFRYNIYVEGHCAANRFGQLMAMGAIILRVESTCVADKLWFFDLLEKDVHYVSIKSDLSNLFTTIKQLNSDDNKCQALITAARSFYEKHLTSEKLVGYMKFVIKSIGAGGANTEIVEEEEEEGQDEDADRAVGQKDKRKRSGDAPPANRPRTSAAEELPSAQNMVIERREFGAGDNNVTVDKELLDKLSATALKCLKK